MPKALAVVNSMLKDSSIPNSQKGALLLEFDKVLALDLKTGESKTEDGDLEAELLKLIEESFYKKKNILKDRRNFMELIDEQMCSLKIDLDRVLVNLNRCEDKYSFLLTQHKENKKKLEKTTLKLREVRNETKNYEIVIKKQEEDKIELENKIKNAETEKLAIDNKKEIIQKEINKLIKLKKINENKVFDVSKLLFENELYLLELEETNNYLINALSEKSKEKEILDVNIKKGEEMLKKNLDSK